MIDQYWRMKYNIRIKIRSESSLILKLLKNAGDFILEHRWPFVGISIALALFLLIAITLSVVCPPAALAVGIGSWSLIGNILPLIAALSFFTFSVCFYIPVLITLLFYSPVDDVVSILEGLGASRKAMSVMTSSIVYSSNNSSSNNLSPDNHDGEIHYLSPLESSPNLQNKNDDDNNILPSVMNKVG